MARQLAIACALVMVVAVLHSAAAGPGSFRAGTGSAGDAPAKAMVTGSAWKFMGGKHIVGASITILEKPGVVIKTDSDGQWEYEAYVGEELTFICAAHGYKTTQYSTVTVPPEGLTGRLTRIYFQVPSSITYDLLSLLMPEHPDDSKYCQFVVTVSAYNLTLASFPQGEPNSTCSISPQPASLSGSYYFGTWGKFSNATNPFTRGLKATSWDGGAVMINIEPSETPYIVTAHKDGFEFSSTVMKCPAPGVFVNAPPPAGPQVISPPPAGRMLPPELAALAHE